MNLFNPYIMHDIFTQAEYSTSSEFLEAFAGYNFTDLLHRFSEEELLRRLTVSVDELLNTNFEKLTLILYRIDVDEFKLRRGLEKSGKNEASAALIARLMLERQLQKKEFREMFTKK